MCSDGLFVKSSLLAVVGRDSHLGRIQMDGSNR